MADQNEIPNLSIGNVFDREKVMGDIARTIELTGKRMHRSS